MLARSRARGGARSRRALACVVLTVGVGGCAAATTAVSVSGRTLTIYAGSQPGTQQGQDVLAAERWARARAGSIIEGK